MKTVGVVQAGIGAVTTCGRDMVGAEGPVGRVGGAREVAKEITTEDDVAEAITTAAGIGDARAISGVATTAAVTAGVATIAAVTVGVATNGAAMEIRGVEILASLCRKPIWG